MRKIYVFYFISCLLLLTGCSKDKPADDLQTETRYNTEATTPTVIPNVMPNSIFYNDQLYEYVSDFSFEEEDLSQLTVLGEITDSVDSSLLPSKNNETNINCLLPTPLFSISDGDKTNLVMEVNVIISSTFMQYSHRYYVFRVKQTATR